MIRIVETLVRRKIRFIAIKEAIEFDGKQDLRTKVMIALFGLFAEVERDLISERTKEGLAAAKAKGKLLGRPKGALGTSRLDGKEQDIRALLGKDVSKASIAKILGVSPLRPLPFHPDPQDRSGLSTRLGPPLCCISTRMWALPYHRLTFSRLAGAVILFLILRPHPPPAGRRVSRACAAFGAGSSAPPGRWPSRGPCSACSSPRPRRRRSRWSRTSRSRTSARRTYFPRIIQLGLLNSARKRNAQRFTTGSNPAGYTLQSVVLNLLEGSGTGQGQVVRVAIHDDGSSGNPGTLLAVLDNPADPIGNNSGTAGKPDVCGPKPRSRSNADTEYWVVVSNTTTANSYFDISVTNSNNETTAHGFSIRDSRHEGTPGSWLEDDNTKLRMEVRGTVVIPPGLEVTLGEQHRPGFKL